MPEAKSSARSVPEAKVNQRWEEPMPEVKPYAISKGCDRASATYFGGIRKFFCPRGPSVPMTIVRES